ncbi:dihydroorotase [Enterococcus camelliae]|uniref:Dihydroorotase n=1 Tax=Enterococcus camelliae TaxID=453959 RepID=A0ABW5TFV2_9ENTE
MRTLLKQAKMFIATGELAIRDIWIEDGRIHAIGENFAEESFDEIYALDGKFTSPGLVDVHVHFREPGFTYKETIATGSMAAARGGFTTVCAMPNVNPVPENKENFQKIQEIIAKDAKVNVLQYASITKGLRSEELVDFSSLKESGAFAFTNDGVGVQTAGTMYLAMKEAAKIQMPIVAHTEDESLLFGGVMHEGKRSKELGLPGILSVTESSQIARDLLLAEATGVHYHVCHVSTKESVRVIRDAKAAGIHVTCEVCPHHLRLIDEDIPTDFGFWKMNPPLRSSEDQQALIEGLLDGTIDCISTDHAPHGLEEKSQSFLNAPFGIVGSEYAFQLMYSQFVRPGIFTLKQVIDWMTKKPADIFGIEAGYIEIGRPADIAVFDLDQDYQVDATKFESMGVNTPFDGWTLAGDTLYTFVNGKLVWQKGEQE